jgi:predicted LPLAT superfamily acyltransferase
MSGGFWYKLLVGIAGLLGPWVFALASRIIATGFFLFSRRVKESRRFYAILFPDRGKLYHLWCAFKQYQSFTTIHLDRFLESQAKTATFTSEGWERLASVIGRQGGILLMSHLGNWEMAATLLKKQKEDLQLLLYMGVKEKEGVERMQKDDLRRSGVTIIGVDQADNSPFSAVAALGVLRSGGLVSMAGDIVWRTDQRQVRVTFLGHEAYLPEAPFIFALLSGAPLLVFFAFRTGQNSYSVHLSEPIAIEAKSRQERPRAIALAAQHYADFLEKALREHPFAWYHFDRFIH